MRTNMEQNEYQMNMKSNDLTPFKPHHVMNESALTLISNFFFFFFFDGVKNKNN